jgi:hypothetical protein
MKTPLDRLCLGRRSASERCEDYAATGQTG